MGRRILLVSQQSLYPCRTTAWVDRVLTALRDLPRSHGDSIVSSLGMTTWDLISVAANDLGWSLDLVVPAFLTEQQRSALVLEYGLGTTVTWRPVTVESPRAFQRQVDVAAVGIADELVPISIRPTGKLQEIIEQSEEHGQPINRIFETRYRTSNEPISYTVKRSQLTLAASAFEEPFLWHWTRTHHGPFPGESRGAYCRALLSTARYPRTAYDILLHIVTERRLRASHRHMPMGTETVSFTQLLPREAVDLMRWRSRYREMTAEPYGVGIRISAAKRIDIRPVHYFDAVPHPDLPRWQQQSTGRSGDWRAEREWRSPRDVDLTRIDSSDLLIATRREQEATELQPFGNRVLVMQKADTEQAGRQSPA